MSDQQDPSKLLRTDTSELEATRSNRELAERLLSRIRSRFLAVSKATHAALLGDSDPVVLFMGIEAFTIETADDFEYMLRRIANEDAVLRSFLGELADLKAKEFKEQEDRVVDGRKFAVKRWKESKPERERRAEAELLKEMKQLKKKKPEMGNLAVVRMVLDKHSLTGSYSEDTLRVKLAKALRSDP